MLMATWPASTSTSTCIRTGTCAMFDSYDTPEKKTAYMLSLANKGSDTAKL